MHELQGLQQFFFCSGSLLPAKPVQLSFIATVGEGSTTSTVFNLTAVGGVGVQTPTISRCGVQNHTASEADDINPTPTTCSIFLRHRGPDPSRIAIVLIAPSGSTGEEILLS